MAEYGLREIVENVEKGKNGWRETLQEEMKRQERRRSGAGKKMRFVLHYPTLNRNNITNHDIRCRMQSMKECRALRVCSKLEKCGRPYMNGVFVVLFEGMCTKHVAYANGRSLRVTFAKLEYASWGVLASQSGFVVERNLLRRYGTIQRNC